MGISRVPSFSDRPGFPAGLRILLVEPNEDDLRTIAAQLRECNYDVSECKGESEASSLIESRSEEFDLIICEASVVASDPPGSSAFVRTASYVPLVLTGENTSQQQKMVGIRFGALDFLEKPVAVLKLRNVWQHTVRKMLKKRSSASTAEADASTGTKLRNGGSLTPRTNGTNNQGEDCKSAPATVPAGVAESAQESTGSSQGDQMHCGKSAADPSGPSSVIKIKADRSKRSGSGEIRAVRRSASGKSLGSAGKPSASAAAAATKATSAGAGKGMQGASSMADLSSVAAGEAAGEAAKRASAARQHSQQPQQPLPGMPAAATTALPSNGMLAYGLHGMPPPLPGCVWGLPMLPPPVPGLTGGPMMAAAPGMMMGHHDRSQMPWGQPVPSGPFGVPTVANGMPTSTPMHGSHSSSMPRTMSAPVTGIAASAGGSITPKASGSVATWSHDASAATNLGDLNWNEVDVDVDVFGIGANTDDLHEFSDSLLQPGGAEGDKSGTSKRGGGPAGAGAGDAKMAGVADDDLATDGLSWMEDDYLMEDLRPLGEQGTFLDVMG